MSTPRLHSLIGALAAGAAAVLVITRASVPMLAAPAPEQTAQRTTAGSTVQPLFTQSTTAVAAPSTGPAALMSEHTIRRATLSLTEKAVVSANIIGAQAHILNLFPDVQIVAQRSRVESRATDNYSWFGYTPADQYGSVIITVVHGNLAILAVADGRRYLVLPSSTDGRYDVVEVDERTFATGDDVDTMAAAPQPVYPTGGTRSSVGLTTTPLDAGGFIRLVPWQFAAGKGGRPSLVVLPDRGDEIDIMFVYTHEAAYRTDWPWVPAGPHNWSHSQPYHLFAFAQLAVDSANQSYIDSQVPIHLNMIGDPIEDTTYQESGNMSTDRKAARDTPWIQAERDARAADLVAYVTSGGRDDDGTSLCGKSAVRTRDASLDEAGAAANGYVAVKYSCLVNYTLAHEFGHQLGAHHDWYTNDLKGISPDVPLIAHGYAWTNWNGTRGFYTIMAYDWLCRDSVIGYREYGINCARVGRWSDPNAIGPYSQPLGIDLSVSAKPSHDAKTITDNRIAVANYRLSGCRIASC